MPNKSKTAREKLEIEREPEVVDDPRGRGKMLVPKPLDVDSLMRRIEKGKLATAEQIRQRLAKDFHADFTCPLTTGIFIRIAAEAAEEDLSRGEKEITPYWRVIKPDGSLNEKLPGGVEAQAPHHKRIAIVAAFYHDATLFFSLATLRSPSGKQRQMPAGQQYPARFFQFPSPAASQSA